MNGLVVYSDGTGNEDFVSGRRSSWSEPTYDIGVIPVGSWHREAKCAESDVDFFGDLHAARALCYRCPVQDECLDDALLRERRLPPAHRQGVFGGMSGAQRRREELRREGLKSENRRLSERVRLASPAPPPQWDEQPPAQQPPVMVGITERARFMAGLSPISGPDEELTPDEARRLVRAYAHVVDVRGG